MVNVNVGFKNYEKAQYEAARYAVQNDFGLPISGDYTRDAEFATGIVLSVLNEFDYDLPLEARKFLVDVENGKYLEYLKKVSEGK